ncbi:efflux RND transporter periplasmic adaptor subunit [Azoarcus olearius]|nr:efflux RND transporter periplasmic adaptor subunit [Azoarcus olearius]
MPIQLPWRRLVPALLMSFSVAAPVAAAEAVVLDAARLTAAGIELAPVQAAGAASLAHLPARVVVPSAQQRFVAAPVAGLVAAVLVGSGETVRAGQPLARIASPELLALRRDLTQAGAEQERARLALQRDQQLHAEGLIPAARLEATRAAAAQAGAALAERRALLGLSGGASEGGGELTIVAPIAGVVLAQPAQPGMRVEAAAPLFHIARLDPLALEVDLPPALAAQLKPGLRVRVPAGGAEGRVVAVGRAVSGAQTVTVRALLDRGLGALGPGQNVEVEIERGGDAAAGAAPVWAVPASALVRLGEDGGGSAVFVRRGDAFVPVPVSVLGEQGGNAVLRGELHADERVAVRGASLLKAAAMGIGKGE